MTTGEGILILAILIAACAAGYFMMTQAIPAYHDMLHATNDFPAFDWP